MNRSIKLASSILLVVAVASSFLFIHEEDVWRTKFFDVGWVAFFYQFSRLVFFGFLLLWPMTLGRILEKSVFRMDRESNLETAIHRFFLGAAGLNILGVVLVR